MRRGTSRCSRAVLLVLAWAGPGCPTDDNIGPAPLAGTEGYGTGHQEGGSGGRTGSTTEETDAGGGGTDETGTGEGGGSQSCESFDPFGVYVIANTRVDDSKRGNSTQRVITKSSNRDFRCAEVRGYTAAEFAVRPKDGAFVYAQEGKIWEFRADPWDETRYPGHPDAMNDANPDVAFGVGCDKALGPIFTHPGELQVLHKCIRARPMTFEEYAEWIWSDGTVLEGSEDYVALGVTVDAAVVVLQDTKAGIVDELGGKVTLLKTQEGTSPAYPVVVGRSLDTSWLVDLELKRWRIDSSGGAAAAKLVADGTYVRDLAVDVQAESYRVDGKGDLWGMLNGRVTRTSMEPAKFEIVAEPEATVQLPTGRLTYNYILLVGAR